MNNIENVQKNQGLNALREFDQWVNYVLVPQNDGTTKKIPKCPHTGGNASPTDHTTWGPFDKAVSTGLPVGFVFTDNDPFFFVDLDHCRNSETGQWADNALMIFNMFPGCFKEVSQSGEGGHIIGVSPENIPHKCDNKEIGTQFYTSGRFCALTCNCAIGDTSAVPHIDTYRQFISEYFPPGPAVSVTPGQQLTSGPVPEWSGPTDDEKLIEKALKSQGIGQLTGAKASFKDLWEGNEDVLAGFFPDVAGGQGRVFDYSQADAALCSHLAYWTGKDCERIQRLWGMSALGQRDKFTGRPDYVQRTILAACGVCSKVYQSRSDDNGKIFIVDGQEAIADMYAELAAGRFIYDPMDAQWYEFSNGYWRRDYNGMRYCLFSKIRTRVITEAAISDERALNKLLRDLGDIQYQDRVMRAATTQGRTTIFKDLWDHMPTGLPCENALVDLQTGQGRVADPGEYLRVYCPTPYSPGAPCPRWNQFLDEIFDGNRQIVNFIKRLIGYCAMGTGSEHVLPIFYGHGRNGKDVLTSTIGHVLGKDLSGVVQPEILLNQGRFENAGGANASLMRLAGKRLVWCAETNGGRGFDSASVKRLTGGGSFAARAPYQREEIEIKQNFVTVVMTNSKPKADFDDYALWKRILLIPFNVSFVDDPTAFNERKIDRQLLDKLKTEAPGILSWIIEGAQEYQSVGLAVPEEIRRETLEYRNSQDAIKDFLDDVCTVGPGLSVTTGIIYMRYQGWAAINGVSAMTSTAFGTAMGRRFTKGRSSHGRHYVGVSC